MMMPTLIGAGESCFGLANLEPDPELGLIQLQPEPELGLTQLQPELGWPRSSVSGDP